MVYTFELAKRHDTVSYATFWDYVLAVEKKDDHTVSFTLSDKQLNPAMVKNYLATTYILPQHVWAKVEKKHKSLDKYKNLEPLGSGPYTLDNYDQTQVGLARHDDYWGVGVFGDLPKPKKLVHPIFKGNHQGDLAFQRGKVDVSQQFTPQIWKMWQEKNLPVSTWYKHKPYHVPGSIPMLMINTHKKGLDDVRVRRALAYAIDFEHIANTAMSRYSVPANASAILPTGSEEKFFDKAAVKKHGWSHDPDKAVQILEGELGAKKGSDGIYKLPDGTRLGPWTAETPTGWSDWQTGLQVVASNAQKLGIDIKTKFPQAPNVTSHMQNGNFDLACWSVSGVGPASPWLRFRDIFDDRGVPAIGKTAFWNYGRFHDDAVAPLLDKAATAGSDEEAAKLYAELDKLFRTNIPMIPLMYRPLQFFEWNASTWEHWPSAKHPYAPPQFNGAGVDWLFGVKKTSAS